MICESGVMQKRFTLLTLRVKVITLRIICDGSSFTMVACAFSAPNYNEINHLLGLEIHLNGPYWHPPRLNLHKLARMAEAVAVSML